MGVITGTLFKGLNFGGIDSRDYGVYITGEAVYNTPVRDVEMINVPGRNGAYALDRGRFENITVTYPAGMMEGTAADFADNISDFRNALAALTGYQRLTDDYNPAEYRQAVYTGGLEVEAATGHNAGEFEIVFTCKPQRFLTAGEQAVTVTSGDELDNPTLFNSRPLLMVAGYGAIDIGSDEITINDVPIGEITLADGGTWLPASYQTGTGFTASYTITQGTANAGDPITVSDFQALFYRYQVPAGQVTDPTITMASTSGPIGATYKATVSDSGYGAYFTMNMFSAGIVYGTPATGEIVCNCKINGQGKYFTLTGRIVYDGANTITVSCYYAKGSFASNVPVDAQRGTIGKITLDSSAGSLGAPLYFDLDIGEAYKYESGSVVSVNSAVSFGADLPELEPGTNVITFDNTVTQLQVVPRWWKV